MTEAKPPRLSVNALFPTFLFSRDHPDPEPLNQALAALAYSLREQDPEGRSISNRGGWQSDGRLAGHEACRPLIRFIESTMVEVKQFMSAADTVNFFVRSCWANINGEGGYNAAHIHGNTFYSGVYYVKTPEDSGLIAFREPSGLREVFHFDYKETTPANCFSQSYQPAAGRMFIFPGYLPHEVGENRSGKDRISVAFNVSAR